MMVNVYSVFDSKIGSYSVPQTHFTDESATRFWSDEVNYEDRKNQWFTHPEDYSLFYIGKMNMVTGVITPEPLKFVTSATALKKQIQTA